MNTSSLLWSALVSLAVFVLMAAVVEILRRKQIRPVETIADIFVPLPTMTLQANAPVSLPDSPTVTTGNV